MADELIIYLDQNKWVELLRSTSNKSSMREVAAALNALETAVSEGRAVVPLSAAHYLETWHRADWVSRHALAGLMRKLSQFKTIMPAHHMLCLESSNFLITNFSIPHCECAPVDVREHSIGKGVNHAFSSKTGRMRLVSSLATATAPEGEPTAPTAQFAELHAKVQGLPDDVYEWWSLAGTKDELPYPGFEIRSEHRMGSEYAQSETELAARLSDNPELRRRLSDYIATEILIDVSESFSFAGFWHGFDAMALIEKWLEEGPGFGHRIIDSLPTRKCLYHLRLAKHKNPQWKWQQHDRADLFALSSAAPYVDVLVTERQWAHVLRSAKIDALYGTKITSNLADLAHILGQ